MILAFDVKVERDAQELADSFGVRIFTADIIYHLFDAFMGYRLVCSLAEQCLSIKVKARPISLKMP